MIKRIVKRSLDIILMPIRYVIRKELNDYGENEGKDIGIELQRIARVQAALYVNKYMPDVDSVTSSHELLTKALSYANSNGLYLEFGVYTGKSINHIAKQVEADVFGFDSFEGLPERWRDGFNAAHFKLKSLPKVLHNVTLIKGWFDETLPEFIKNHGRNVSFIHVDCDLYTSTKVIFDNLADYIGPGTIIVFDEYFNYPGWKKGEIKAFHEFIRLHNLAYEYIGYNRKHEQVAIRISSK